ncbi:type 1 glutamine amidotransferase-like domain-containing protein [Pseudarthrobacter psychrotolerans]|uniref:Type 1 glutamine amidotransferase-like domain-containing protein n=1 Tax=Pseudarthrobacter psychrotolerans TaxID=2697569 RepID=A0A6P1NI92_9MICC|nr:Type 1 glutamine amidotransferase-like domain-containing protein [Pseudarthrobacter psychrotolerans]QHK18527.1 type 1 glutamine amidotransferase-like domain-containing protein [Pseudarthrobacter psychrotolerans]
MLGTIYLGGGGSPDDELPVWTDMLQGARRILYWPFALSGDMLEGADAWLRGNLTGRWPSAHVSTWTTLNGHSTEELADFDILFIGGGNTFDLLEHVMLHGFAEPVRRFIASGGSFYGGSAGAILASDDIGIAEAYDDNKTGLTILEGLGLTPGATVLPHYGPDEEATGRRWSQKQGITVLGIPERSGLKISGGQARVLGREPIHVIGAAGTTIVRPGELLPAM